MSSPSSSSTATTSAIVPTSLILLHTSNPVPESLKFLISSLKTIVTTQLSPETFSLWKSQITKLFSANGYFGYLDGTISPPSPHLTTSDGLFTSNPEHSLWTLVDKNLSAALTSTVSPSLHPHLLHLPTCHDISNTIQHRLQSTNRSRLTQLKQNFYTLQMKNQSMAEYLSVVKSHVDALALSGYILAPDDIIHHTLNGLPTSYQPFKTSIRTNLQPLSLDDFYSLLCSEESNLAHDTHRDLLLTNNSSPETALLTPTQPYTQSSNRRRSRSYSNHTRPLNHNSTSTRQPPPHRKSNPLPICQICHKPGHSADRCWHRANLQYQPQSQQALIANPHPSSGDWVLDTGATSHLTPHYNNLLQPQPYNGPQHITVGNGSTLPIAYAGHGILPTPSRKLLLSSLFQVPHLTHNIISVNKLVNDNACSLTFDSSGFTLRDRSTNSTILRGQPRHGLYSIRPTITLPTAPLSTLLAASSSSPDWHARTGHPQSSTLHHIARLQQSLRISTTSAPCQNCHQSKSHRLQFSSSKSQCTFPFGVVHSDVWGPFSVPSLEGFKYFVTFIDEYSRFCWLFPLL